MKNYTLDQWERDFREAAKADGYSQLRRHLSDLKLNGKPQGLLEDTVLVVQASVIYAKIDGIRQASISKFLRMQSYVPQDSTGEFAVTFDLCGKSFARAFVNHKFELLDLADLFNHPWNRHKVSGYQTLWISRIDGGALSRMEIAKLKATVTEDLRFDYTEDEVSFWFDDSAKKALRVEVQDYVEQPPITKTEDPNRNRRTQKMTAPGKLGRQLWRR